MPRAERGRGAVIVLLDTLLDDGDQALDLLESVVAVEADADALLALGDGGEPDGLDVEAGADEALGEGVDLGVAVHDDALDRGGGRQEHLVGDLDMRAEVVDQATDLVHELSNQTKERENKGGEEMIR